VFPTQLMIIRRSKKGTVKSLFLNEENDNYTSSVIELFRSSVGKSRGEIEESIKELELKSQNPKIVRAVSLLLFRMSKMEPPSHLDPLKVREKIFSYVRVPPVSPESREEILRRIADDLETTPEDVIRGMYADKESEQILVSIQEIEPKKLMKRFNMEQVETVMLKAVRMMIVPGNNFGRIIRLIRRYGLLYTDDGKAIFVSGPMSLDENVDRYGLSFSLLVRSLMKMEGWSAEVTVLLKNNEGKKEYIYILDHSFSEYLNTDEPEEQIPAGFLLSNDPVKLENKTVYPDYEITLDNRKINIIITRPRYYEDDLSVVKGCRKNGLNLEIFCILFNKEKCPSGAICFKDNIDWYRMKEYLITKYEKKNFEDQRNLNFKERELDEEMRKKIILHLQNLYPDTQAMLDYLDFMGLEPVKILNEAGFNVRWKGLRLIIEKYH